jgi:hypothetical protein
MDEKDPLNGTPDETWSLQQLGQYCLAGAKKLASDAWTVGVALNLASKKCKAEKVPWIDWCKEYCPWWSRHTVWRYREIATKFTRADVEGKRLSAVYDLLGIRGPKPEQPPQPLRLPAECLGRSDFIPAVLPPPGTPIDLLGDEDAPAQDGSVEPAAGLRDDGDLMAALPPEAPHHLPAVSGLLEDDADSPALEAEPSPEEHYWLHLQHAQGQMAALQTWISWLMDQDEGFRKTMWADYGSTEIIETIERTIERLAWLSAHLGQ